MEKFDKSFKWESDDVCILVNVETDDFVRCKSYPVHPVLPGYTSAGKTKFSGVWCVDDKKYSVANGWSVIVKNASYGRETAATGEVATVS